MNIKFLFSFKGYLICSLFFIEGYVYSQQLSQKTIADSIISISNGNTPSIEKLNKLYFYKKLIEKKSYPIDSVYAELLHLLGKFEYIVNGDYVKAIDYTLSSIKINALPGANKSPLFALNSYFNIAFYYKGIGLYTKSLQYFDSTIIHANHLKQFPSANDYILDANIMKAFIYFRKGDYQKSIEQSTVGINNSIFQKDSTYYLKFLNQRSQAYFYQYQLEDALFDLEKVISITEKVNNPYQSATAYKTKGLVYAQKSNFNIAALCFEKSIQQRILTKKNGQIAEDYNDFGNFYADSLKNQKLAKVYYFKGIEYAKKDNDSLRLARINANIGNTFFQERNFSQAEAFYGKAFSYLKLNTVGFFANPSSIKTNLIGDKELLIYLFSCKTELLLNQYLQNRNQTYLTACLYAALTTDSVINETRHEQVGEQSKLYWRNNTRSFYCNALEACYLANNSKLAFFFMEKSRAVLLNDRLNELGASSHLPTKEAEKEDSLRSNIIQQEQQLADLKEGTKLFETQQLKYLNAKSEMENYIHSLEQKFPVYYQYKYNDQVPDLETLQQFLAINNQAFIHYFITDSIIYILGVTPNNTKLIKVAKQNFSALQLSAFLKLCADYQTLNANYPSYINLSNLIYTSLFKPLQIQQKRVVVCADNFLIPFGALCADNSGKHFLVQDFAFSYAYSARSLLKQFNNPTPKGDLLGVAPVLFTSYLQLPELKQSAAAMSGSSSAFNNTKLLLNDKATKYSFIKMLPQYSIVNVFSHASADSSGDEPLLFMADSMIHLSELQAIKLPSTQLVVLSACQTNVGKLATGEGVYSLARGFASSGIPAVAATLWKADEDAIYEITQSFDYNLAQGMRKDDALQQAELAFMQHGDEKLLPYFWANMVLVGNSAPIKLSSPNHWVLIVLITGIVLLIATFFIIKNRQNSLRKDNVDSA